MSDVNHAPAPANETPISEQGMPDSEVSNRAPDRQGGEGDGTGSDTRRNGEQTPSRREALQRAMDRAKDPSAKGNDGQRDGRQQKGAEQRRAAEQRDDKGEQRRDGREQRGQREQTEQQRQAAQNQKDGEQGRTNQQQARDNGRFARRDADGANAGDQGGQVNLQGQQDQQQQPRPGLREAPQRFDEAAKRDWGRTPESVRGAVSRMHDEFSRGYEKVRADVESFEEVREFHDMAKQHGTTLRQAVQGYWEMEQRLRGGDVVGGIAQIISNLNLKTSDGHKLTLMDFAHYVAGMSPEQVNGVMQGNQNRNSQAQMQRQNDGIQAVMQRLDQFEHNQRLSAAHQELNAFKAANPRFDELADAIEHEMTLGFDLDEAYKRADKLYPSGAHTPNSQAAQTRRNRQPDAGSRSISGSPDGAPSFQDDARSDRGRKTPTRREALSKAMRAVGGF
jgi:hypothetical protein